MEHTFNTFGEAVEAGYTRVENPGRVALEEYRDYTLVQSDVSGGDRFGYAYAVRAFPTEDRQREMYRHRNLGPFGETVTVWGTKERNKLRFLGAFVPMWEPGALEKALDEARQAIDAAYDTL